MPHRCEAGSTIPRSSPVSHWKGDTRMCGIMGYAGTKDAAPIIIDGLRRLEYRGYDSAGVAVHDGLGLVVAKAEGKLGRLAALLDEHPLAGSCGIGHTRWATHGAPSDRNAHPHTDPAGEVVVVHNGIIENFLALKESLAADGADFASDTDTEVLAHLVAREYDGDLLEAVRRAVGKAEGAYALVAMCKREPGRIVAVRMISPLVIVILKEIFEQPQAATETLSGRLGDDGSLALENVHFPDGFVRDLDKIWITACGTALHAGYVGKEIFERLLRIPTEAAYAHELRYANPLIASRSLTIAISQSGETADTLAAAGLAKRLGSRVLALTNVVGSTLSREADDILYTPAA